MYVRPEVRSVVVANGGTTSEAFGVGASLSVVGVQVPAAITSATLGFLGSTAHGGTYGDIADSDGNLVSVALTAGRSIGLSGAEADAVSAYPWLKIKTASAEGAERTFTVSLR